MTRVEAKIFSVGDTGAEDFTTAEMKLLAYQIADWFKSPECDRNYEDALQVAKDIIEQCLLGTNRKGEVWKNAPDDFYKRILIKTQYDPVLGKGNSQPRAKHPQAVRNEKEAKALAGMREPKSPTFDFNEHEYRENKVREILKSYPELDTPAHRPNVRRLALLYAQQEVISNELAVTTSAKKRSDFISSLEALTRTVEKVMKSMDIHPDQVRKRLDKQREGTLADLVALLDGDEEFAERERIWALTTALQLWWMSQHPNGRGDEPQLHPFEIWHMTRSRPISFTCECGRHYPTLVEGFVPEDLRNYLVERGVLVEEPVLPNMLPRHALSGLTEYLRPEEATGDEVGEDLEEDAVEPS